MAMRAHKIQSAKVDAINELKQKISSNSDFIFAEYRGLTVEQISALRRQLRTKNTDFHVVKNNFARLAFEDLGYPKSVEDVLSGPTGIAYTGADSNEVAKLMFDFAKEVPALKIKGGMIDRGYLNQVQVEAFSKLPGKKQLLSMLMSAMNGPAQSLLFALNGITTKLVRVLKAVEEKKSQEG